jgi:hypothetical protein
MSLAYDWKSGVYRAHGLETSFPVHSFETLAAARHGLRLAGLRLGAKTDPRTWQIELIEPVDEHADRRAA